MSGHTTAIDFFARFTEAAKEMLVLANREAQRLRHGYFGAEHLLLALVTQHSTIASEALATVRISEDSVRSRIEAILGRAVLATDEIVPTLRAQTVVERAWENAKSTRSEAVATDHILIGLLAEGESIAAHVLADCGATEVAVRAAIAAVRDEGLYETRSL